MAVLSTEKLLEYLPNLFETDIKGEINIFRKLEKILAFDEGFIYFANPDSLQLKFSYKKHTDYKCEQTFDLNKDLKAFVFDKKGDVFNLSDKIIQLLKLNQFNQNSYIISKLMIKSTVFGIVVLSKKEQDFYKKQDLDCLNAAVSILSYILKDSELSNVFKIQLKALKDGIVEKNNAYKVIKEQNEKILEADRVKNEFLANISHELRTPLNSILGFADILSAKLYGNLNDKQEEYINDIKASGTHLLGMINEILDMSKIEAHAMKIVKSRFFISRAVSEVKNILMPLALKKGISINADVDNDFEVYADYQKIQQILYNLVSNAIKYSPENDIVDIAAISNDKCFRIYCCSSN